MNDEFDQLTNEQIDDLLRQHGYDPAKVETTGRVFAEMCLENVRLRRQLAEAQAGNIARVASRQAVIGDAIRQLSKLVSDDFHGYRSEVWSLLMAVYEAGRPAESQR